MSRKTALVQHLRWQTNLHHLLPFSTVNSQAVGCNLAIKGSWSRESKRINHKTRKGVCSLCFSHSY